jgi:hypothetical protein
MAPDSAKVTKLRAVPPTTDALRARIDRGGASDKVDFSDPAASPLGTDDEAAGTPPKPTDIAVAAHHELGRPPVDHPNDGGERAPPHLREGCGIPLWTWIAAAVLLMAGLAFALLPLG